MNEFEFLFINEKNIYDAACAFGIAFCGGFTLSVILHLVAYGVFGLLSLLNINK